MSVQANSHENDGLLSDGRDVGSLPPIFTVRKNKPLVSLLAVGLAGIIVGLVARPSNSTTLESILRRTAYVAWTMKSELQLIFNFRREQTQGLAMTSCICQALGSLCGMLFVLIEYFNTAHVKDSNIIDEYLTLWIVVFIVHALLCNVVVSAQCAGLLSNRTAQTAPTTMFTQFGKILVGFYLVINLVCGVLIYTKTNIPFARVNLSINQLLLEFQHMWVIFAAVAYAVQWNHTQQRKYFDAIDIGSVLLDQVASGFLIACIMLRANADGWTLANFTDAFHSDDSPHFLLAFCIVSLFGSVATLYQFWSLPSGPPRRYSSFQPISATAVARPMSFDSAMESGRAAAGQGQGGADREVYSHLLACDSSSSSPPSFCAPNTPTATVVSVNYCPPTMPALAARPQQQQRSSQSAPCKTSNNISHNNHNIRHHHEAAGQAKAQHISNNINRQQHHKTKASSFTAPSTTATSSAPSSSSPSPSQAYAQRSSGSSSSKGTSWDHCGDTSHQDVHSVINSYLERDDAHAARLSQSLSPSSDLSSNSNNKHKVNNTSRSNSASLAASDAGSSCVSVVTPTAPQVDVVPASHRYID